MRGAGDLRLILVAGIVGLLPKSNLSLARDCSLFAATGRRQQVLVLPMGWVTSEALQASRVGR
jgi:hypothetical protein